ncbi:hypothetical protein M9Y10_033966 [Tritrichomonas musculus]|uniref:Myb-like DNA-binding domain containing protein n=1 Tax=Tritrichomonas musculus TaxID=1915356 RepID=A0ABR2KGR0_9EUKA
MSMIVPLQGFAPSIAANGIKDICLQTHLSQTASTPNINENTNTLKSIQIPINPVYFQGVITNQIGCLQPNQIFTNFNMKLNCNNISQVNQNIQNNLLDYVPNSFVFCHYGKKSNKKTYNSEVMNNFPQISSQNKFSLNNISLISQSKSTSKISKEFQIESLEDIIDSRHRKFSVKEDEMLKNIVNMFGPKNWRLISSLIPGRTPRQCRDRYSNYLAPGFIHSDWTEDEDKLLAEKFALLGPKWAKIRQFFPYRTANDIKNRYNYSVSRKSSLFKNANTKGEYEKEGNDLCFNDENFDFNQQFFLFNEELQSNEYDFVDNEL